MTTPSIDRALSAPRPSFHWGVALVRLSLVAAPFGLLIAAARAL